MAISNFNGTLAKFFKLGDITIYTGSTPYEYEDLGQNGDIFIANDGVRYSKVNGEWQQSMAEWTGTDLPDNTLGQNGDLYRLLTTEGISGSKYIKLNDTTIDPVGIKWLPATKELYSSKPNNELFNELDFYQTTDKDYVKIDGKWIETSTRLSGNVLPETRIGNNGDIYYCTSNTKYYYKVNGVWFEVSEIYVNNDTPVINYGLNDDVWLGETMFDVYLKENNNWVDKTLNNLVCGANGIIINGFYPNKAIVKSLKRTYYVKINDTWQEVNKLYRSETIPEYYTGDNGNIAINASNTTAWVKTDNQWSIAVLAGSQEVKPNDYWGLDGWIVYVDVNNNVIIDNNTQYTSRWYKNYNSLPEQDCGSVGDIYIIRDNKYYKDTVNNWSSIDSELNYQSQPYTNLTNDLDYYMYSNDTNNYICIDKEWHEAGEIITPESAPHGFEAEINDVYITADNKYFVYTSGWLETNIYNSSSIPNSYCGVNYDIYQMADAKYAKIDGNWIDITYGAELSGNTEPDINIGNIYDTYLDTSTNTNYIKTSIDVWTIVPNIYNYNSITPPETFWLDNELYVNIENTMFIKTLEGWVEIENIFNAANSLPPSNYWADETIYEYNDYQYIKYNNSWNQIIGYLDSHNIPNDYMWNKGTIYDNGSKQFIKISDNSWLEITNIFNSDNIPDSSYWDNSTIYETSTRKYFKLNNIWETVLFDLSAYDTPSNSFGINGMIYITANYDYLVKLNNVWRLISSVLDKNTAPKYNSYGIEDSMYLLSNNCAFVKNNGIWLNTYETLQGEDVPFNDVGEIGSLFYLTTDNTTYVLYSDYSWRVLGSLYNTESNPLDTDGSYLWLYVKSDDNIVYKNENTWVQVSSIIKSNNLPTINDGEINNLWITLSTGLYIKDNEKWSKILTTQNQTLSARQEIYLLT